MKKEPRIYNGVKTVSSINGVKKSDFNVVNLRYP